MLLIIFKSLYIPLLLNFQKFVINQKIMRKSKISEFEIIKNLGIININNPPNNILDEPDFIELSDLKDCLLNNPIKGLIISSKTRHFSVGANKYKIYEDAINNQAFQSVLKKGIELLNFIENLEIPSISCINGACFGGGLEIALCTSVRICARKSLFSFPEPDLGLIPGLGGISRIKRLMNNSKLIEFVLSSEIIDADKALELNIVDYVVDNDKVLNFSIELMNKMILDKNIEVINSIVRALNNSKKFSYEQAINEEMKMFCNLAHKEALKRFKEEN